MNAPWYGTDKLQFYDPRLQDLATDLFRRVEALIGTRAKVEEGSVSFERSRPSATVDIAAKLVIYKASVGRGDHWQPGADGVYVLLRTRGNTATFTLTVALRQPTDDDRRFAFFLLQPSQDLGEMARFIAACCDF
ncbi:MAG: hypothetical protein U0R19_37640 [Bryobacteraceae bacterium]